MVEPIVHYLVPTLILLAFLPQIDRKLILKLSPLAIIPDFDFLIGHLYLFHNLIFAVGIPALLHIYSKNRQTSLLAFYFLGSHLLLDAFGPGVGFFYPFYDGLFRFDFYLYTSPATGAFSYEMAGMTQALTEATKDQLSPVVTPFGVILVALISAAVFLRRNSEGSLVEKLI
jgi:hypothetical protein